MHRVLSQSVDHRDLSILSFEISVLLILSPSVLSSDRYLREHRKLSTLRDHLEGGLDTLNTLAFLEEYLRVWRVLTSLERLGTLGPFHEISRYYPRESRVSRTFYVPRNRLFFLAPPLNHVPWRNSFVLTIFGERIRRPVTKLAGCCTLRTSYPLFEARKQTRLSTPNRIYLELSLPMIIHFP